jgi:Sulfotransferase domain
VLRGALWRLKQLNTRRTTDVYFVAYPKTGSTWLRFMLGCYLQELHGLDEPPLFDVDRWGRAVKVAGLPGVAFTHRPLEWTAQTADHLTPANVVEPFRGKTVVLLARYPLDALVSLWHHEMKQSHSYEGDLVSFTEDPVLGLDKLLRFYTLWETQSPTLIRYEDMREDPGRELTRALESIGSTPVDDQALAHAVERGSFASMKAMEVSGEVPRYASSGVPIFGTGDTSDPNAFHVRKGEAGGYRSEYPPELVSGYEARIAEQMGDSYGYDAPPVPSQAAV